MRFTQKLTVGFGLVAALAMLGLFFLTLRQYDRSNHLNVTPPGANYIDT